MTKLRAFFFILLLVNLLFASWYVLHEDITFNPDIARDFLLLAELDEKKFVLIGPRSSVAGLFHGPLWLYLNYPAYLVGEGNPVVVGWNWIVLLIIFLASSFFMVRALFDEVSAWLFVLMASLYMVYHTNGLFNPHGAMFVLPAFFYFFVRFLQRNRLWDLLIHVFLGGLMIQFQMAIGVPFVLLSFFSIIFLCIKRHRIRDLAAYAVILIPLSTFLLFDIRHDFLLLHNVFRHLQTHDASRDFTFLVQDRFRVMTEGIEFLRFGPPGGSFLAFLVFLVFLFLQIKHRIQRQVYGAFLFFFVGFFVLSLLNRYPMLPFYVFPLFLLVFLIFASFATSRYKVIFFVIFAVIYLTNLAGVIEFVKSSQRVIGKEIYSWKFLSTLSETIYQKAENPFGYFVYAPDVFAYEPKYAMLYAARRSEKKAYSFEKKPYTYLIMAPNKSDPYMKPEWWRLNQIKISAEPVASTSYDNGYRVEKHHLTEKEIAIPFDPVINPGIHFR